MDGDSWFSTFVPRTAKAQEKPASSHNRRVSLLKQPNVSPPSAEWVRGSVSDEFRCRRARLTSSAQTP
jgi:hypothetical protein